MRIHFCFHHLNLKKKKKYHSVPTCTYARIIHYISGILVSYALKSALLPGFKLATCDL